MQQVYMICTKSS